MKQLLRFLPAVHELQKDYRFLLLAEQYDAEPEVITEIIKNVLSKAREQIVLGKWRGPEPGTADFNDQLFLLASVEAENVLSYTLKKAINATGTILHTNLGRARLSDNAIKHVIETAGSYSNLEFNLEKGERGSRHAHVESLLRKITGAEAAMVVNNNAAAVYLVLSALAKGREVIVSRGQLVEIGGSFRISSIMEESGALLNEVGTTNKTHLYDYEQAIHTETAMIMKVHTSNFSIHGFTKTVETADLAQLSKQHDELIFYEDLGSGVLYDFTMHGIGDEPVVSEVIKMGADLVSFSGDKLLGGPQAGIIAGKKTLIDKLKKNQMARVVRVDKMTLAALEGTLMDYLKGEKGLRSIPTIRDLLVSADELERRTAAFAEKANELNARLCVQAIKGMSQVGGGTMPDVQLPTWIATITHAQFSVEQLAKKLRQEFSPAIIVRIQQEAVHIDLRTVDLQEEHFLLDALAKI